jgi:hypothetical protein
LAFFAAKRPFFGGFFWRIWREFCWKHYKIIIFHRAFSSFDNQLLYARQKFPRHGGRYRAWSAPSKLPIAIRTARLPVFAARNAA